MRLSSIEGEDELSFWHALVRDVAYQQIPRAPRAEKHMAAARWVEEIAGERAEDQAETLVHHYGEAYELAAAVGVEQSDVRQRLRHALLMAGDRATSSIPRLPNATSDVLWNWPEIGRLSVLRRWRSSHMS